MRHCFRLEGRAVNDRQVSILLPNDQNGVVIYRGNAEHWNIRGATLRGGWRHSCMHQILARMRRVSNDHKLTTDTARLLGLGGVKSSGASKLMTPAQIEQAQRMNPLIEMMGCSDPAFLKSHTYVSHMTSEHPIDRSRGNRYNHQVVRRPLAASGLTTDDLSDPERMAEFDVANRFRSQLETLGKRIGQLERSLLRKPDPKTRKELDGLYAELQKLTQREFNNSDEVQEYITQALQDMRTKGLSTVSERNIPVGQEVIPIGTAMLHQVNITGASTAGVGLLMEGISAKNFLDPVVGGKAALGCGGWLTIEYNVKRLNDAHDAWVDDCLLRLVPEQPIEFHDAEHSRLKACLDEWRECDITRFDFTFEGMQRLTTGAGEG